MRALIVIFIIIITGSCSKEVKNSTNDSIDISGKWNFKIDKDGLGEEGNWYDKELSGQIHLPGTIDEAGYGKPHIPETLLSTGKPEIWQLARKHFFVGTAWYRKNVNISEEWSGKKVTLLLERSMWQTKLWINGVFVGERHSLCAPDVFDITSFLKPGENVIAISVDNTPYVHLGSWSHGYSPGIQTIWNGIVGRIEISARDKVHLDNVQVYPSFKDQKLIVRCNVVGGAEEISGKLKFKITDDKGKIILIKNKDVKLFSDTTAVEVNINLENKLNTWDEFSPELYHLEVSSLFIKDKDVETVRFGLRDFESVNGRFVINGNKVFMRGEHDAGSFPLTGYPSMKKEDWLKVFNTGKDFGFNHWRFHSWCPPEAAFEAADETGIYLQPELPLFSQDWEHTLVGMDKARDEFLFSELNRILSTYGNHPSFVFMCMGNELRGDHKVLERWVKWGKLHDPRHLYAGSANLEAMGMYLPLKGDDFQVAHAGKYKGRRVARRMYPYFNNEKPNTENDYSKTIQSPFDKTPVMSHEVGQWTVFPDFTEIPEYTGVLLPRNLDVFKSRLEQKGMLNLAHDFLMASGKLSALLYREEVERLLRTPHMGGFQLLDLRDYPAQGSAMIGMLNVFWEPKGFITADEWRQSCNDVTLLLKMPKRVWKNDEKFNAGLVIPDYLPYDLKNVKVNWSVLDGAKELFSGVINGKNIQQGEVNTIGAISFDLSNISDAKKLTITLKADELHVKNGYDIWVYPSALPEKTSKVIIATKTTLKLLKKIENGAKVLLVPKDGYDYERTTFTTPFWSTILFDYQVKTMGVLCNPNHPVFNSFPTDFYTNWQWWELLRDARSARLNKTASDYKPVVQVIDHPVRNDKLGALVETKIGKGKLFVCTLDILSDPENRIVARQLNHSILKYMNSPEFDPAEVKGIKEAFFNYKNQAKYQKIESENETSSHPAIFAFDNDENTYWQSMLTNSVMTVVAELQKERYITGCSFAIKDKSYSPGNFKVYVSNDRQNRGDAVILGNTEQKEKFEAVSWDNGFTIQKGKKGKFITIVFEPVKRNDGVIKINEIDWSFGD